MPQADTFFLIASISIVIITGLLFFLIYEIIITLRLIRISLNIVRNTFSYFSNIKNDFLRFAVNFISVLFSNKGGDVRGR